MVQKNKVNSFRFSPAFSDHTAICRMKTEQVCRPTSICVKLYWFTVVLIAALIISSQLVFAATNMRDAFSIIMKDIYGKLLGVSTIIVVAAASIAPIVRMISRNQRAVDEATS